MGDVVWGVTFTYLFVLCVCVLTCSWGSKDNSRESVLSFRHLTARDDISVFRLGSTHSAHRATLQVWLGAGVFSSNLFFSIGLWGSSVG